MVPCCLQLQGCQILKHMRKMEIFQDSNITSVSYRDTSIPFGCLLSTDQLVLNRSSLFELVKQKNHLKPLGNNRYSTLHNAALQFSFRMKNICILLYSLTWLTGKCTRKYFTCFFCILCILGTQKVT